jgi:hypothetical protein
VPSAGLDPVRDGSMREAELESLVRSKDTALLGGKLSGTSV